MSRTTITLTPEVEGLIRRTMRERGQSFKDAVNEAIVRGLSASGADVEPYVLPTFDLGVRVPLDDVTGLLNRLDDEEFLRAQELGK